MFFDMRGYVEKSVFKIMGVDSIKYNKTYIMAFFSDCLVKRDASLRFHFEKENVRQHSKPALSIQGCL